MWKVPIPVVVTVAAFLGPVPAGAQDVFVERASYRFLDSRLTIHVHADVPGELQVIRGRSGRLQVRATSHGGLAAFGFQDRGIRRLNLSSLGGESVRYLVVVPGRVRVDVQLPDRDASVGLAALERAARFEWDGPGEGQESSGG